MKYNFFITLKKAFIGVLYTVAAAAIAAAIQAVTSLQFGPEAPAWVQSLWMFIMPGIVGGLTGAANWLKNKNNV